MAMLTIRSGSDVPRHYAYWYTCNATVRENGRERKRKPRISLENIKYLWCRLVGFIKWTQSDRIQNQDG
jgi:hypothetical protein